MRRKEVTYKDEHGNPTFLKPGKKGARKAGVDVSTIALEPLMGTTKETKILDLVLPLNEGTIFTDKQVIKALGLPGMQIRPVLTAMVNDYILFPVGSQKGVYVVNNRSKRIWALKTLLVAIYTDAAHYNAVRRLGIK